MTITVFQTPSHVPFWRDKMELRCSVLKLDMDNLEKFYDLYSLNMEHAIREICPFRDDCGLARIRLVDYNGGHFIDIGPYALCAENENCAAKTIPDKLKVLCVEVGQKILDILGVEADMKFLESEN